MFVGLQTTIMKFFKIVLVLCPLVVCEIPPPSPHRDFRPSPQLSTIYGPPKQSVNVLNVGLNSKLTIEQLIKITEQLQNSVIHQQQQNIYIPPQKRPQLIPNQINRPISASFGRPTQPQTQYGVPELPEQMVSTPFARPINVQSVADKVTLQSTYGLPHPRPQENFMPTQFVPRPKPPATNYGVPDTRNLETFGDLRNFDQSTQDFSKQLLPRYNAPSNFKPSTQFNSNQGYLPAQGGTGQGSPTFPDNGNLPIDNSNKNTQNVSPMNNQPANVPQGGYLPPQTTPNSILTTLPTVQRPPNKSSTPSTTVSSTSVNSDYDYDVQQTTQTPLNEDDSETGPNISISNAVAGGGDGYFYVQQPDGRIQRVTLQKFQQPNSKPGEYVAQYYFQNVDAVPSAIYAPLINLETFVKK